MGGGHMYNVLLAISNDELLKKIKDVDIWSLTEVFEIKEIADDGNSVYEEIKNHRYDLIILQTDLKGISGLELLSIINRDKLCANTALCSLKPDFKSARWGIMNGAFDYFTEPFDRNDFTLALERLDHKLQVNRSVEKTYIQKFTELFLLHDKEIKEKLDAMKTKIFSESSDADKADNAVKSICRNVIKNVFSENEWLELYVNYEDYAGENISQSGDYYYEKVKQLFSVYEELMPDVSSEKINEIILYILNNPESDLRQKTIAATLFVNSSYLSTVFSANTEIRFVDYVTQVKLKRAGWLLLNTDMKISEIAFRLDYKDIGYFSRMFKKQYDVPPSEYRTPINYTY